jgi:prepilin-type N-terminal cleavage/methylation domain-containing protein
MRNGSGKRANRRNGMSLVELLVVLVVLAILAGLATLAVRRTRARGDLARATAEAHNFRLAEEMYRATAGRMYNGPFTSQATQEAGFSYTPPPDITITIESAGESDWKATLMAATAATGPEDLRPVCRLSLNEGTSCALTPRHREELPDDAGGAAGTDVTPVR